MAKSFLLALLTLTAFERLTFFRVDTFAHLLVQVPLNYQLGCF
jgi:hypothetical protein